MCRGLGSYPTRIESSWPITVVIAKESGNGQLV